MDEFVLVVMAVVISLLALVACVGGTSCDFKCNDTHIQLNPTTTPAK